jgi:hypothetical protein
VLASAASVRIRTVWPAKASSLAVSAEDALAPSVVDLDDRGAGRGHRRALCLHAHVLDAIPGAHGLRRRRGGQGEEGCGDGDAT